MATNQKVARSGRAGRTTKILTSSNLLLYPVGRVFRVLSVVPRIVPTPGTLHRFSDRLLLWMYIALGDAHVPVSGQVGQRPRVHMGCPACQTGVSQRVKRKWLHAEFFGFAGFAFGILDFVLLSLTGMAVGQKLIIFS